jgi:hypothetical protein
MIAIDPVALQAALDRDAAANAIAAQSAKA